MLKAREERRKVLTQARMRCGATWSDVYIVNLSNRGVGLQSPAAPSRGTFVELRRGSNVIIIGQVVWSKDQRFGVRTQDQIWIDGVLNDAGVARAPTEEWRERRAMPRPQRGGEWSRFRGRMLQHGFIVTAGLCATVAVGSMVNSALARPMHQLAATLATN